MFHAKKDHVKKRLEVFRGEHGEQKKTVNFDYKDLYAVGDAGGGLGSL